MYLLVFVTLVVALTGVYGEVLAVQTKHLYANQTGIAGAMRGWHATAVGLARYAGLNPPGANGCSFSYPPPTNTNTCANAGGQVAVGGNADLPLCNSTLQTNCWTNPPPGYQTAPYAFNSIYYQAGGQGYVVTYVLPPTISAANPAPGLITSANNTQLGITMSDLMTQIKNSALSPLSYGTVINNLLVTPTVSNGTNVNSFTYTLPTSNVVKPNSIALISPL